MRTRNCYPIANQPGRTKDLVVLALLSDQPANGTQSVFIGIGHE